MDQSLKRRFLEALAQPAQVTALRTVVEDALARGTSRKEALSVLEALRGDVAPASEDAVLDVMDMLAGWSAPHVKL